MSKQKFLAEAQKCEEVDKKERAKALIEKAKIPKRKRVAEDDNTSNLNRSQRSRNQNGKRQKNNGSTTSSGIARECELCKASGAPEFLYKSHYTNQCKKKDEYKRKLSGGMGVRKQTQQEFRATEKQLKRELGLLKKVKKLKKETSGGIRKRKREDFESSDSSSDELSE